MLVVAAGVVFPKTTPLPPAESESAAVSLRALYAVETELAEQAGTWDADRKLLDAMLRVAKEPRDRAEVLRRRCGLEYNVNGPQAALDICLQALRWATTADPITHHRTGRRLAKVMSAGGMGEGALAVLDALPPAQAGLEAALTGWVRAEILRRLNRLPEALLSAKQAAQELETAIQAGAAGAEYRAIADYELGRAITPTDPDGARMLLTGALVRQRALDQENPEYAEYRLYLARILWALVDIDADPTRATEANTLTRELQARDPQRWEYKNL